MQNNLKLSFRYYYTFSSERDRKMSIQDLDVWENFCQERQIPIFRPNEILDQIVFNVFVLFLQLEVIVLLKKLSKLEILSRKTVNFARQITVTPIPPNLTLNFYDT